MIFSLSILTTLSLFVIDFTFNLVVLHHDVRFLDVDQVIYLCDLWVCSWEVVFLWGGCRIDRIWIARLIFLYRVNQFCFGSTLVIICLLTFVGIRNLNIALLTCFISLEMEWIMEDLYDWFSELGCHVWYKSMLIL